MASVNTDTNRAVAERPHLFEVWMAALRPKTLTAALAPLLAGSAVAFVEGGFHAPSALAALFAALAIQVGTNLANDVFDFEKGADTHERLGPVRVTQAGWLSPRAVRIGMVVAFGLAVLAGTYLIARGGWPILAVGVASILSGIAYTGGPWPLAYLGLGDLFVFVFFGLVATAGTTYVQTGTLPPEALLTGIPIGMLSTAVLVVNNLRDCEQDAKAGKRTLAVRFGATFARVEYAFMTVGAILATPLLFASTGRGSLLPLALLPVAAMATRSVFRHSRGELNVMLARTSALLLGYAMLLSVGLVI